MIGNKKDIELRSEKVRNIVGQIPPLLLRKGILIISLVIVGIIVGAYFMPYPETVHTTIQIESIPQSEIIKAPCDGIIYLDSLSDIIRKDQTIGFIKISEDSIIGINPKTSGKIISNFRNGNKVNKGDILAAINPDSIENLYGIGSISATNKDKIKPGQSIKLELTGYISKKYGLVEGYITKIYPLLMDSDSNTNQYKIEIFFPNKLETNYKTTIEYIPKMRGRATIYISNQSVLERFLNSIRVL